MKTIELTRTNGTMAQITFGYEAGDAFAQPSVLSADFPADCKNNHLPHCPKPGMLICGKADIRNPLRCLLMNAVASRPAFKHDPSNAPSKFHETGFRTAPPHRAPYQFLPLSSSRYLCQCLA